MINYRSWLVHIHTTIPLVFLVILIIWGVFIVHRNFQMSSGLPNLPQNQPAKLLIHFLNKLLGVLNFGPDMRILLVELIFDVGDIFLDNAALVDINIKVFNCILIRFSGYQLVKSMQNQPLFI